MSSLPRAADVAVALWLVAACNGTSRPSSVQADASAPGPAGQPTTDAPPWLPVESSFHKRAAGPGCAPTGPEQPLVGRVSSVSLGPGRTGVILDEGPRQRIVSYGRISALDGFEGVRVEAMGRPCAMEGEAVVGMHFDLSAVRRKVD